MCYNVCIPREGIVMYAAGEHLVHPGQGVCIVDDITGEGEKFYQLIPVGVRNPMRISFPVANEDRLRPVLSRDEAETLIARYDELEVDERSAGSPAAEEERFRDELRRGTCEDAICIIKTIRARIAAAQANKRKAPVAFERVLKHATQRAYVELSIALDCTIDDVAARFDDVMATCD